MPGSVLSDRLPGAPDWPLALHGRGQVPVHEPDERAGEDVPLRGRQRLEHLTMDPVGDLLPGRGDPPARLGNRDGARSVSLASSIWVRSPGIACTRTQKPRGVIPMSANAAVIRVAST
jgi:hypothetical protein